MIFVGKSDRIREEQLQIKNKGDLKSLNLHTQLMKMVEVTDKKRFYNQVKSMVEREMKANEHLFVEKCPQPILKLKDEFSESKNSIYNLEEKVNELKKKRKNEERKFVEEKLLQLSVENSEEMRLAAVARRKKEMSETNYNRILTNDRMNKEEKIEKRKRVNVDIRKEIKIQVVEKEELKRKVTEKKERYRKELDDQVRQKELIKNNEKTRKHIECKNLIKMWNEEKDLERAEITRRIDKREQRKADIKRFIETKVNAKSNSGIDESIVDKAFVIAIQNHLVAEAIKK